MNNLQRVIEKSELQYQGYRWKVYAHYRDSETKEDYEHHIRKTTALFEELIRRDKQFLKKLLARIGHRVEIDIGWSRFMNYLKELVQLHDIGKCNPKFQCEALGVGEFDKFPFQNYKKEEISSDHAYPSALISVLHLQGKYDFTHNFLLLVFPYAIWGHHTRLRNCLDEHITRPGRYQSTCEMLLELLEINLSTKDLENLTQVQENLDKILASWTENDPSLSLLYSLIYSYLATADSVAASYAYETIHSFEKDIDQILNDRINKKLLRRMKRNFTAKQQEFQKKPDRKINSLRQEMFEESLTRLDRGLDKGHRVYYLKLPTGGGKTNTSMGLSLKILQRNMANRIIYSLPYTNIIDQNYESIKESYGLKEPTEIRKIYSGAEFVLDLDELSETDILLDDDFFNYPVLCTTNVSFFNTIVKFSKKHKQRLHAFSNSVVILDEVQSLPLDHWPTLNYLINELAEQLDMYFIVMSATVPSLEKLVISKEGSTPYGSKVFNLIENPEYYFQSIVRNELKSQDKREFDLNDADELNQLKNHLKSIIEKNFAHGLNRGLIVVNTVWTSRKIHGMLDELNEVINGSFESKLLNSTFLPHKKKEIIRRLTCPLKEGEDGFILVSTQSIEAGMDVNFDFVVRDYASLDSIEQVRGRCNRELERDRGYVYLLKLRRGSFSEGNMIYDRRKIQATRQILQEEKDYEFTGVKRYYDQLINILNEETKEVNRITEAENIANFSRTKFEQSNYWKNRGMNVFHLDIIEQKFRNYSFFVKTDIPIVEFSEAEVLYLQEIAKSYAKTEIIANGKVKGDGVLRFYLDRKGKLKRAGEYIEKKMLEKEFGSILQKFMFQLAGTMEEYKIKLAFGEPVGWFFVINQNQVGETPKDYYSLDRGFHKERLKEADSSSNFIM